MNQILMTEEKKDKKSKVKNVKTVEINGIVKFFAIAIMVFGIIMIGQGSYAIYRDIDDRKPANIPTVTIGRVNDKAIVRVEHNVEISRIIYSWDDDETNTIPVGMPITQEEITLLGYDSILNLTVEDINGKSVTFRKQYNLTGVDLTKPTIEIITEDGVDKAVIVATDETAILSMTYYWDEEEPVIIDFEEEGQKEIVKEIPLTPGTTRKLTVIAEDLNGNVTKEQEQIRTTTSKPQITIKKNGQEITIEVSAKDGIKDILVNLNGQQYPFKDINQTAVRLGPVNLREGNNTFSIDVTTASGYVETATTEINYTP